MNKYDQDISNDKPRQLHKIRAPYLSQAKHINDNFTNLGYNYAGNILKNGTSPELWANPQNISMFGKLEGLLVYLLESSKMIKKWFSIAHSKDTTRIM